MKPPPGRRGAGQRAPKTQNHEKRGPIKAKQEANELRNKTKITKTRGIHVIKNKDGTIKYQMTCYRIFAVFIIGEISITSGLIRRARKFEFVLCLMTSSFRVYSIIGNRMEGNTMLHHKQYEYDGDDLARFIVLNKIKNQKKVLGNLRYQTDAVTEAIDTLGKYEATLHQENIVGSSLLGLEGSASKVYFPQIFNNVNWKGRKPRIKNDYINSTLDIGYTMLFNIVDSLLQLYGFDVYQGVYHKEFYMRKSLVCDLMEPMRPLIDYKVRKAINLKQCKQEDFKVYYNSQWTLIPQKIPAYIGFLMEEILDNKEEMFLFIQSYYRSFMKGRPVEEYRMFNLQ